MGFVLCSVKPEILKNVGQAITTLPEGFTAHKGIQRVYDARRKMIETGEGVDWATAESLAFATLLVEGTVYHPPLRVRFYYTFERTTVI